MELLKIDDPQERSFYLRECEQENWGVRELKRQMSSMLYQRLALSKNKRVQKATGGNHKWIS